jgi:ribosome maturation factor RimP
VRGYGPLVEGRKQVDGVLAGFDEDASEILLDLEGERIAVPLSAVARANLRYRFGAE